MKKILFFCISFLFCTSAFGADRVLNLYIWSGYLPTDVLQQFQQETGIQINYSTFDSNETLYAKLKAAPNAGYDIVVPSSYFVDRMRQQGMLQKLDKAKIPNFKHLNPALLNKSFDPNNDYSIPYFWLATGIVYNSKYYAPGEIQHWSDFWNQKFKDQLLLLNDMSD